MPQREPTRRTRPGESAGFENRAGGSIDHQSIPTPPPGATIGWWRQQGVKPTLAGVVIGDVLSREMGGSISVLLECRVVLELETLYRIPLSDQPERIRALGIDIIRLADVLNGTDRGQVAA